MGSTKASVIVLTSLAAAIVGLSSPRESSSVWSAEFASSPWQSASLRLAELKAEASQYVVNIDGP